MSEGLLDQLASITGYPLNERPEEATVSVSPGLLAHLLTFLQGQFVSKLHRQQLELDASREQVQVASQRLNYMRSQLRTAESSSLEANSKLSALESRCSALEAALGKERGQAKYAAQELQNTLDSFASFRRQQAEHSSTLRSQLENAQFEAQTARAEADRLETQTRSLNRQLTSLQDAHIQLKAELKLRESRFLGEMDAKERLIQAYAQAAQTASLRALAAEDEIEGVRGAVVNSEADFDGRQEEWRVLLQESNQRCKQLQVDLDRVQASLNSLLNTEQRNDETVTDARVVALEVQLERMREALEEAVGSWEATQPRLEILANDNSRLQGEIAALTETVISGAAAKEEISHLRKQLDGAIKEGRALVQENADLARQVQALLAELEGRKLRASAAASSGSNIMDAADLITSRLVDFNSIASLQARNQELLKALRSTCANLEALESAAASADFVPRAQLEEVRRELEEAREARIKQAALVDRFLKGKIDETVPVEPITKVKVIEVVKEAPVSATIESLTPITSHSNQFEIKCAHLEAQFEVAQERVKFSQEALEALKADHSTLVARFTSQQGTLQFLQAQGERAAAELATLQDRNAHLQGQVGAFKKESVELQASLTHLQAAHDAAVSERDRLSALIPPLQSMLTDHEASEAALKRHFDTQLAFMERELQATRKHLSDSTAAHSQVMTQIEGERSELLKRLETVMQEAHSYKQSTIQLEVQARALAAQVQELEGVLNVAASKEMEQDQHASKVSELKLRALAGQVKELKEANSQGEAQLAELQNALQSKQAELEAVTQEFNEARNQLSQFAAQVEELKSQLTGKDAEIESLQEIANQVSQLQSEVSSLNELNSTLQAENQSTLQDLQARFDELAALKTSLANCQSSLFETESQLNGKASALTAVTKEVEHLRSELASIRQENSALMDELTNTGDATITSQEFEALKPSPNPNDSRLLQLLRSDKDKLIQERDQLAKNCTQLQAQLDLLQSTLNSERAAVSTQAADYARLLQQIEEFQGKSTEGIKARLLVEQLKKQLLQAETASKELISCTEALERAQAELRVLNEIVGEKDAEVSKLRAEMESLKQTSMTLKKTLMESKLMAAKEIDALKRELGVVKQELEAVLTKQADVAMEDANVVAEFIRQASVMEVDEAIVIGSSDDDDEEEEVEDDEKEEEIQMSSEAEAESEHEAVDSEDNEHENEQEHEAESDGEAYLPDEHEEETSEEEHEEEHEDQDHVDEVADSHESKLGIEHVETVDIPETVSETVIVAPVPAQVPTQPARKIVSLVGITSSTSTAQSTAAPVPMITTASGKKIIPITAPEPTTRKAPVVTASTSTTTSNTSAAVANPTIPSSPGSDTNANKRNKKKKKPKKPISAGVGKNVRRN